MSTHQKDVLSGFDLVEAYIMEVLESETNLLDWHLFDQGELFRRKRKIKKLSDPKKDRAEREELMMKANVRGVRYDERLMKMGSELANIGSVDEETYAFSCAQAAKHHWVEIMGNPLADQPVRVLGVSRFLYFDALGRVIENPDHFKVLDKRRKIGRQN